MFAKVLLESFCLLPHRNIFLSKCTNKRDLKLLHDWKNFSIIDLTDTDSICIFFIFICKPESCAPVFGDLFEEIIKIMFCTDSIPHINFGRIWRQKWTCEKKKAWLLFYWKYWQSLCSYCCAQSIGVFWRVWESICP